MSESLIDATGPKREWLLRCYSDREDVLTIEVQDGGLGLFLPPGSDTVRLERSQIGAFRDAFREAVSQAEADLRTSAP